MAFTAEDAEEGHFRFLICDFRLNGKPKSQIGN